MPSFDASLTTILALYCPCAAVTMQWFYDCVESGTCVDVSLYLVNADAHQQQLQPQTPAGTLERFPSVVKSTQLGDRPLSRQGSATILQAERQSSRDALPRPPGRDDQQHHIERPPSRSATHPVRDERTSRSRPLSRSSVDMNAPMDGFDAVLTVRPSASAAPAHKGSGGDASSLSRAKATLSVNNDDTIEWEGTDSMSCGELIGYLSFGFGYCLFLMYIPYLCIYAVCSLSLSFRLQILLVAGAERHTSCFAFRVGI